YFIEGVKLYVSFDDFDKQKDDVEMNVTVPAIDLKGSGILAESRSPKANIYRAEFKINGAIKEKRLEMAPAAHRSVGRAGGNDLMLDDASVSKIHASLSVADDGRLVVADTGSTNGTFINGQ